MRFHSIKRLLLILLSMFPASATAYKAMALLSDSSSPDKDGPDHGESTSFD